MKRRGLKSVARFGDAMLATLSKPANAAKGPWEDMTVQELIDKLREERKEVDRELRKRHTKAGVNPYRLRDELVDEANVLMMLYDRCCAEIEKGG